MTNVGIFSKEYKYFCKLWLKVHKIFSGRCLHFADGVDRSILQAVEAEGWASNRTAWLVQSYTRLIHGRQQLMLIKAARTPNT